MPTPNVVSDEGPSPNYSHLDSKDLHPVRRQPSPARNSNPNPITTQQESRSTTSANRPIHHDSQDHVKPRLPNELGESKKPHNDSNRDPKAPSTPTRQRTSPPLSTDRHEGRSGPRKSSNQASDEDFKGSSLENDYVRVDHAPRERKQSTTTSSSHNKPITRLQLAPESQPPTAYAQATSHPKDSQYPPEAAGGSAAREGAPHHPSVKSRPTNDQVPPGNLPEDEQHDRMSDVGQSSAQGPGYGIMDAIMSVIPSTGPPPPKDRLQLLKEEHRRVREELKQAVAAIEHYERELRRKNGELRHYSGYIDQLQQEKQRSKDCISGLQNELNNVHQQLEDAKHLSEVRGKELFGAQVFLTKADTLSISEAGEKVTALNEEIFQAAATLGEALVHKRHEASQEELDAAARDSMGMIGEKMTKLLITQSQKPEPEVNPLVAQVVLQIFMVKFCVSKIQSWYPGDRTVGEFLTAIYSEIRSTEEQAVSGRWRALTRAHTRPSTEEWSGELYQKLFSILKIASWMTSSQENEQSFGHRLPPIFKAITELRMAMGENFTSADLDISVFDCDIPYDPSIMDDAYSDGRKSSGKRGPEAIVGTTGMGLKKLVVERNSRDALQFSNVISAKIVLKTTLDEALEPVQPSAFGRFRSGRRKKPVETADLAEGHGGSRPRTGVSMDTT